MLLGVKYIKITDFLREATMKSTTFALFNILLFSFLTVSLFAKDFTARDDIPQWFLERTITPKEKNEYIGYGMNDTLATSLTDAKADISNQIEANVYSSINITKTISENKYDKNVVENQYSDSKKLFIDSIILRQEYLNGKWYTAVGYEDIPPFQKFLNKIPFKEINKAETRMDYRLNIPLIKKLNNGNLTLQSMNNDWYIGYQSNFFKLDIFTPDLFMDFKTSKDDYKVLKQSSREKIIIANEEVKFQFLTKKKYVSLFAVNQEGQVMVLQNNIEHKITNTYEFDKRKDEFERIGLFVAVYSNEPTDNSYFRHMNGRESRESYNNEKIKFDSFITFLEDKEYIAKKIAIK